MTVTVQPLLFDAADLPVMASPVSEASMEWRQAQLLRLVEAVRFNPEALARYAADNPDRVAFLDFTITMLGGRSQ